MSGLFWLKGEQAERRRPFSREPRQTQIDYRRVLSGIIFVNRNKLRWRDAP